MNFKEDLAESFPVYNDEIDTAFLLELLYYFPIDKTYISVGSYDQYLYDLEKTVIDNYDVGNYQVSFFYAHLIFMSYVYYCVERVYKTFPDRTRDVFYPMNAYRGQDEDGNKLGKPNLDSYRSVYDFSTIPEKDIFKLFYIVGMPDNIVKDFGRYINKRDNYAHATGKGNISEQEFQQNIRMIIGNMNTLRELFLPHLKKLYIDFVVEHIDVDYDVVTDNFNDFVFDKELSIKDIDYLCHLGVKNLQESNEILGAEYQSTRNIHCAFIEYCMENDGIEPPEGYQSLRNKKYLYFRYKGCAAEYIENELNISAYECAKEGDEFPLYECPNCDEEQLVYDMKNNKYHCFHCDTDFSEEEISFCSECGKAIKNAESYICDTCLEEKIQKE